MINDTTRIRTNKINPRKSVLTKKVEIPTGKYHNCNTSDGIVTIPRFKTTYVITGMMIPFSHIGTMRIGLKAIGDPKITGSLILKIEGTIVTRPMAFKCFDLASNTMSTTKGSVVPIPPIHTHAIIVSNT